MTGLLSFGLIIGGGLRSYGQTVPCAPSASSNCTVAGAKGSSSSQLPATTTSPVVDGSGIETIQQANSPAAPEPADPLTDFQRLAQASTGESLTVFGRDLFQSVPSTFAPGDQIAVAPGYLLGAGDEVLLRIWGPENFNGQLTVDRSGDIYVPKVGAVHVAGLRFDELQKQISSEIGRVYRNFDISVNLGRLRSIQVYVVGEARHPGAYTISSLSTVLNLLFACGGPNAQGSLRRIQVRRGTQPAMEFDLYDFILHGDKSKDARLEAGDTLFIPAVGPQVALGGSVRHPAIYELAAQSTVGSLLEQAGGLSPTASSGQLSLERIKEDRSRITVSLQLDTAGRDTALRDGDVIFVNHITAAYENTVTIRGYLANPGRFPWHPGMRLSDIIPDRKSLLTTGYWEERNRLGLPAPLFDSAAQPARHAFEAAPVASNIPASGNDTAQAGTPNTTALASAELHQDQKGGAAAPNLITYPAPQIDWAYAVIERLDPNELKNVLVPFNLGRLVKDHDPAQNLELQPGDIVTVFSQNDVQVPRDMQTKYVRLEGEFVSSGVYSVGPEETLGDVIRRAGGLTPKAYLYGSNFTRESARVLQQQRLDEYVSSLSADLERSAVVRSVTSISGTSDPTALAAQRQLVEQLRRLRATGRVVLNFSPESSGIAAIPDLPLEDGDVFQVSAAPSTVSVVGAVYGPNVFLYNSSRRLVDYVALAGRPNRIADSKHAFIIRPDGSILSRERAQGSFSNHFDTSRIYPGDSIVIPEKLIKPPILRDVLAYSQILSSFGLAAAAINVLR